jgi:hypothetical protein
MLIAYWFKTDTTMCYGVTAESKDAALRLLAEYGYPFPGQTITAVVENIKHAELDQNHIAPNSGPLVVRGIWYPMHNI